MLTQEQVNSIKAGDVVYTYINRDIIELQIESVISDITTSPIIVAFDEAQQSYSFNGYELKKSFYLSLGDAQKDRDNVLISIIEDRNHDLESLINQVRDTIENMQELIKVLKEPK